MESIPNSNDIPGGYRVLIDCEKVKDGDRVLDYAWAEGYAEIKSHGRYHHLIDLNAHDARLNNLCFEVFTPI